MMKWASVNICDGPFFLYGGTGVMVKLGFVLAKQVLY
jgi:hypothetical protein